jgi:hypothetical protein
MGKIIRATDLTKIEGDPTSRSLVDVPLAETEELRLEAGWLRLRLWGRTPTGSPLSRALTAVLLGAGGSVSGSLIVLVGLPHWTAATGLLVPVLYFALSHGTGHTR